MSVDVTEGASDYWDSVYEDRCWWAPFLHSPITLQMPVLMGTIFTIFLKPTFASECALNPYHYCKLSQAGGQVPHLHTASMTPPKPAFTFSPHKGMLPEPLLLVTRKDCVSGLHRSEAIREIVLSRLPHQGNADSRLK